MAGLLELHDRAVQLMVKIYNDSLGNDGRFQIERQERLEKVLIALLEFKSEAEAEEWLKKPNPGFDNVSPIDLINSKYATPELLRVIENLKNRKLKRRS